MRPRPHRLERLPPQYFGVLLARVAEAAAREGDRLVDIGRGNPDVGPPPHVVEALTQAAGDERVHGYGPFRGLPQLREAIAARYAGEYGVDLDPHTEVAILPGTKTAHIELALVLADHGDVILLPDPGYPDYPSGVALANAKLVPLPLDPDSGWAPEFGAVTGDGVAAIFLNYPSNPCAVAAPEGAFEQAVSFAGEAGAAVVHDFAYGDLVYDGRTPQSFLATPGAREVGVEMFSMSKTYGMAGWRLGFVLGNAEIVERLNVLQEHTRVGIFGPLQEAAVAALTGPQDSVDERRETYQRRRDSVLDALASTRVPETTCEGTFYVWIELPEGVTFERLLTEHRVAVAPGEGFGSRGAGWARLSLAIPDAELELGLDRLCRALA